MVGKRGVVTLSVPDKSVVAGLVEALTRCIVTGEFNPGDPLAEQQIARRFGTSRTPVREALRCLERDGLVVRIPGRGMFVASISTQDIEEVFMLRELLETAAVRLAVHRIPETELDELERILRGLSDSMPHEAFFEADHRLHDTIVKYSGNRRLGELLSVLNTQVMRVRHISALRADRLRTSAQEHLGIVEALKKRDADLAAERLRVHLQHVRDSALEVCRTGLYR